MCRYVEEYFSCRHRRPLPSPLECCEQGTPCPRTSTTTFKRSLAKCRPCRNGDTLHFDPDEDTPAKTLTKQLSPKAKWPVGPTALETSSEYVGKAIAKVQTWFEGLEAAAGEAPNGSSWEDKGSEMSDDSDDGGGDDGAERVREFDDWGHRFGGRKRLCMWPGCAGRFADKGSLVRHLGDGHRWRVGDCPMPRCARVGAGGHLERRRFACRADWDAHLEEEHPGMWNPVDGTFVIQDFFYRGHLGHRSGEHDDSCARFG